MAAGEDDTGDAELDGLRQQRWRTGKDAVAAIKAYALALGKRVVVSKRGGTFKDIRCSSGASCTWFVKLSVSKRKHQQNNWHVTTTNLKHINCTSTAKPSAHQLAASSVLRSAVVADASISALAMAGQLQEASKLICSTSMLYRVKDIVLREVFSEDEQSIKYLPWYLEAFAKCNIGVFSDIQRDGEGHFVRAMAALDPAWFRSGQGIFGVDAAHMKNRQYNGVQIVLVARDGNLQNRVAAVALAPLEDHSNYFWFFKALLLHGFPLRDVPVFSDRHAGIISASDELKIKNLFCTRHLIGNMRADKKVKLAVCHEAMVWRAQAANTPAEYKAAIQDLSDANVPAGEYLNAVEPKKWALHPYYKTQPLYGWRTTNFVESEQAKSLRLKPRKLLPYGYFRAYTKIMMTEAHLRLCQGKTWTASGRITTPRSENKFQCELKQMPLYSVSFISDEVA